jgi:hypothetical protein
MNTRKLTLLSLVLWIVTITVIAILFIRGQTITDSDGRTAILLNTDEKDLVLEEMRNMLSSVQGIVEGLSEQDLSRVANASRTSGSSMARQVPPALMTKLPLEFKQLGHSVHTGFDELTVAAKQEETSDMILSRLSGQLSRCVACHAAYRLQAETQNVSANN